MADGRYEEELAALGRAILASLKLDASSERGKLVVDALGEAFHWGQEQARAAAAEDVTRVQATALTAIASSCDALRSSIESQTNAVRRQTRALDEFVGSLPHVIEQRREAFRKDLEQLSAPARIPTPRKK